MPDAFYDVLIWISGGWIAFELALVALRRASPAHARDAGTLRRAKRSPEQYRDLIVRVAGYSDYFCDLGEALQDEIIARTEHQTFGG